MNPEKSKSRIYRFIACSLSLKRLKSSDSHEQAMRRMPYFSTGIFRDPMNTVIVSGDKKTL
jgi:hypothetical protein